MYRFQLLPTRGVFCDTELELQNLGQCSEHTSFTWG